MMERLNSQQYQLIAHRGYSAVAPENTLASFKAALNQSIWGVEFDVHISADGVPVIIHDGTVERTTNGSGKVAEKLIAQLQSLNAGTWFHPQFANETIPTLEQVLTLFWPTQVTLYIELKSPQTWSNSAVQQSYPDFTTVARSRCHCVLRSYVFKPIPPRVSSVSCRLCHIKFQAIFTRLYPMP